MSWWQRSDTTNLFFTPFAGFISRWEESWLEGKKVTKQWNNYSCFLLAYGNDWDINPEAENQEMSLGHFFAAAHFERCTYSLRLEAKIAQFQFQIRAYSSEEGGLKTNEFSLLLSWGTAICCSINFRKSTSKKNVITFKIVFFKITLFQICIENLKFFSKKYLNFLAKISNFHYLD